MIERANPIPSGVYWIDAFGPDGVAAFRRWAGDVGQFAVTILRDEPIGSDPDSRPSDEVGRWFLFSIAEDWAIPRWTTDTGLGLPTVATPATRQGDIVQRPPPSTPGDILREAGSAIGDAMPRPMTTLLIGVGVGALVLLLLARRR